MNLLKIGKSKIGDNNPVFIIAEIGGNFSTFEQGKKLIDSAISCGANAVKIQTFKAENYVSKFATFTMPNVGGKRKQLEIIKKLELDYKIQKKMFEYCADPKALEGLAWLSCYVTTPKHMSFYSSFLVVMCLLALAAPLAMLFGFLGAIASRSSKNSIRILGKGYLAMIRGIPDIVFFLFIPIALDQAFEFLRHKILCPEFTEAVRQGNDFVVCKAAKLPLSTASEWVHDFYGFSLALLAFGFVFGAFTGNVLSGAMAAVPKSQLETGAAFGFSSKQILPLLLPL